MTKQVPDIHMISQHHRTPDLYVRLREIMMDSRLPEPFPDAESEAAFEDRWLRKYFDDPAVILFISTERPETDRPSDTTGYILVQPEPVSEAEWQADMPYYESFAAHLPDFPAHLHINMDAAHRGRGVGAHLLNAACAQVRESGARGIHLITAADARNVGFYTANGFSEIARDHRDKIRVMLGRSL